MTALSALSADPLVSEFELRCIVVAIILTLSGLALISKICSRWGADCWEQPPTYAPDRAGRDGLFEVTETEPARDVLVVEHVWCDAHEDGDCDELVCCCPTTDGLPCPGTAERGCSHPVSIVCDRHRSSCTDCAIDRADDAGALR